MSMFLSGRVQHPINVPMLLMAVALVLVAVSSIIAVSVTKSQVDDDKAVVNCRGALGALLSNNQTDYLLTMGEGLRSIEETVSALAQQGDLEAALALIDANATDLAVYGNLLRSAANERLLFEASPSGDCDKPVVPSTPTGDTVLIVPDPTTSTTRPKAKVSRTTTTMRPTSTTGTTRPPTTTTEPPSLCDLIPPVVTTPREIPCPL